MIQRSSALAITASIALAAARLFAPGSAARTPVVVAAGHAYLGKGSSAKPSPVAFRECTAYAKAPVHKLPYPNDDNAGEAKGVIDKFFGHEDVKVNPRVVIALAPDPRHTNLSLMFDREISTIQHAAQDEGYDYNSSWMPWKTDAAQPLAYLADRQHAADLTEERENCPGVILFRQARHPAAPLDKTGETKEAAQSAYENALIVFIVGEQATGGVNEKQWANAVAWLANNISAVNADLTHDDDRILRILGPTFSGSLVSLERDLERAYAPGPLRTLFPKARILSGSASSCSSVHWFQNSLASFARKSHLLLPFGTFQENDALHIFRFLEYVQSQGTELKDVAILSEDETAYAALSGDAGRPHEDDPCDFPYTQESRPVHLVYPRDISAIRDAYSKQSVFDSGGSLKEHSGRAVLHETTENAASGDDITDTVPAFSGEVSALAQEAYLYGVVSFLRSHHSRYLVLRCTNPLDFLFLTRFFHRAYPQARIVTVGSDLLFRREIDTTEFRGVLSLTAYPLLPSDQHWSRISDDAWDLSAHNHLVFEGQLPEGTYLAARYLLQGQVLANSSLPLIVPSTDPSKPLILHRAFPSPDYANPFWLSSDGEDKVISPMHPPTWLVTVGRDGYWPVAVLSGELHRKLDWPLNWKLKPNSTVNPAPPSTMVELQAPDNLQHYQATPSPDEPNRSTSPYTFARQLLIKLPLPWTIAAIFAFLLASYHICGLYLGRKYVSDGLFAVFQRVPDPAQNILQGLSCALALLPLVEVVGVGYVPGHLEQVSSSEGELAVLSVVTLAAGIAMLVLLITRWTRPSATTSFEPPNQNERRIYIWTSAGAFAVFLAAFTWLLAYGLKFSATDVNQVPLFYRMSHLTDGVSPLLPVLLLSAGFYLWVWQALAGNLMLRTACPSLPETAAQSVSDNLSARAYRRLHKQVDPGPNVERLDQSDARLSQRLGESIRMIASPSLRFGQNPDRPVDRGVCRLVMLPVALDSTSGFAAAQRGRTGLQPGTQLHPAARTRHHGRRSLPAVCHVDCTAQALTRTRPGSTASHHSAAAAHRGAFHLEREWKRAQVPIWPLRPTVGGGEQAQAIRSLSSGHVSANRCIAALRLRRHIQPGSA